jgi:hypothetical protein
MKNKIVDVNVYIVKKPGDQAISKVVEDMKQVSGIINASVNKRTKHLLDIQYDANQITGRHIINHMSKNNCQAALVGF